MNAPGRMTQSAGLARAPIELRLTGVAEKAAPAIFRPLTRGFRNEFHHCGDRARCDSVLARANRLPGLRCTLDAQPSVDFSDDERAAVRQAISERLDPRLKSAHETRSCGRRQNRPTGWPATRSANPPRPAACAHGGEHAALGLRWLGKSSRNGDQHGLRVSSRR